MGDNQKRRSSPTRTNVENKLTQDELRLTELQFNLDNSEKLTGDMVSILDSFTSRLKKLDDTILPVYNETLQLTRLQDNIQKTLSFMERVIGFYHVAEDVDVKIREGPSGSIEPYLVQLSKLREAIDHFQHFNEESLELEHLNELFYTGREALIREFLQLLKKHSKPVHVAILHDIAYSEELEDTPAITLLPTRVVTDLKVIADYLVKAPGENQTDIMSVYAQIRCNQLGRAMNSLVQSSQGESLLPPSVPKKSSFASSFLKAGHTPNRKSILRKGAGGGGPSGGGGGGAGGGASLPPESASLNLHDESLEGCSSFMVAATVFLQLIQSEVSLMKEVIPSVHHTHVLDNLIRQPVDYFMSQGDTLLQQAKKGVAHNDYPVVLSSLRLLRHIKTLLPVYRVVLQNLESKPSDRLLHLLQQFDKLCAKALQEDFIQYIKVDSEKLSNLPKDGTVHSLTSSTMRFIESLLEYVDLLGDIFRGQNSFSLANEMSEDEKRKSVGQYLVRVLDALNLNLEHKARNFESPHLAALFLLNNFKFVHKTFTQNERLADLLEKASLDVENHYVGLISQQGRLYQRGFQKLIGYLGQEMSLANISSGDKLSNQKRQLLKDKFKGFNSELDELLRIQKDWSIPDSVLRTRVREDNINLILPLYTSFYEMFGSLNFTKNYDKYLKYTPSSLNQVLLTLFDGGAR